MPLLITFAASVAAMAPATTIGAAHPVTIGGGIPGGNGQKPDDTMKQKLENFSVSYIEAIAAKRNRNVEWAGQPYAKARRSRWTRRLN